MDRTLDFPRIILPPWFNREKRVHEMRLPTQLPTLGRRQYGITPDMDSGGGAPPAPSIAGYNDYWDAASGAFKDEAGTLPATATNDAVKNWTSLGGQFTALIEATSTNFPKYATGSINGLPSLLFDSTNVGQIQKTATLGAAVTYFVVARMNGTIDFANMTRDISTASGLYRAGTNSMDLFQGSSHTCTNNDLSANTWAIITAVFNGASSTLRVNKGTRATGNPGSSTLSGYRIGIGDLNITRWEVYLSALSTGNQDTEVDFLAARYGISV